MLCSVKICPVRLELGRVPVKKLCEVTRFGKEETELNRARSGSKCFSTTELGTARSGKATFGKYDTRKSDVREYDVQKRRWFSLNGTFGKIERSVKEVGLV